MTRNSKKNNDILDINYTLGIKIQYCRKALKFTQSDFSVYFKIDRSCISYYEKGKVAPSLSFLLSFSKCFNISLDDLIDNTFKIEQFKSKYSPLYFETNTDVKLLMIMIKKSAPHICGRLNVF